MEFLPASVAARGEAALTLQQLSHTPTRLVDHRSSQATMKTWYSLPREVQQMIFDHLRPEPIETNREYPFFTGRVVPSLASYAAVDRSWRHYLWPMSFEHILLDSADVDLLQGFPAEKRGVIKSIWLRIELTEYCHDQPEEADVSKRHVTDAITSLFQALSEWDDSHRGIALEVSVHSASDPVYGTLFNCGTHVVKSRSVRNAVDEMGTGPGRDDQLLEERFQRTSDLSRAYRRWTKRVLVDFADAANVPKVPVVKEFLVRRHTHRVFTEETLSRILVHLPCIKHINFEPWRKSGRKKQNGIDQGYVKVLAGLPNSVESISVFENIGGPDPRSRAVRSPLSRGTLSRKTRLALNRVIADRSTGLEKLSLSFLVDAGDFFNAAEKASKNALFRSATPLEWARLKTISLTETTLDPKFDQLDIYANELLSQAANFAAQAPNLQTMEIWNVADDENGEHVVSGVFRYYRTTGKRSLSSISWAGTFDIPFSEDTIAAWNEVAEEQTGSRILVEPNHVTADVKHATMGEALQHLELKLQDQAVPPLSMHQMCNERPIEFKDPAEEPPVPATGPKQRRACALWFP